uniref:Ovule protein n=1 Tax=Parascaris univalens TaxID=6257 RepID=A0A914ZYY6_PARUN
MHYFSDFLMKTAQAKSGTTTSFRDQLQKQGNTLENDDGVSIEDVEMKVFTSSFCRNRGKIDNEVRKSPSSSLSSLIESTDNSVHSLGYRAVSPRRQNRMRLEMLRHRTGSAALFRKESRVQTIDDTFPHSGVERNLNLSTGKSSFGHYSGIGATTNAATSFPHHLSVTPLTDSINEGKNTLSFGIPEVLAESVQREFTAPIDKISNRSEGDGSPVKIPEIAVSNSYSPPSLIQRSEILMDLDESVSRLSQYRPVELAESASKSSMVSMKPMGTSNDIGQRRSEQVAEQSRASKIATVHELMRSVGRALGDKAGGTAALFERSFGKDDSRLAKWKSNAQENTSEEG